MMNKLFILLALTLSLSAELAPHNIFLNAVQEQVPKIIKKTLMHKLPLEFKQAVFRYIKHTDINSFQTCQRNTDENLSYKKELRYLFKNYGKFSAITLLARIRSAHQAMVRHDTNTDGEAYKKYEQICSALLLVCSQAFFNEMRTQILNALHAIDNLIIYWRYQYNHQINYFFSKSPAKWIVGKDQYAEIMHNITRLERKQRELYILLGSLTGHIHEFAEVGMTYQDCYVWTEALFAITSSVKTPVDYATDGTQFDDIAAELEWKLKRVKTFKSDCMALVKVAKKPNHFTRNWTLYATALAATAYLLHYNAKNPEIVRSAFDAAQDGVGKFFILLLHPLKKIYERGKLAFSDEKKGDDTKKQVIEDTKQQDAKQSDYDKPLDDLFGELREVAEGTKASISEELKKSNTSVRQDGLLTLQKAIEKMKDPQDKCDVPVLTYIPGLGGVNENSNYKFDENAIRNALETVKTKVKPIKEGNVVTNKQQVDQYEAALKYIHQFVDDHSGSVPWHSKAGRSLLLDLNLGRILIRADEDYLNVLEGYTDIIDKQILRLFQLAAVIVEKLGKQGDDLITKADQLEIQAYQQLKDHELTLMFTTLIPLGFISLMANKGYQWATTRNYSPIRIALSDVNSLLIESAAHIDDHDYGKLVYLICKLRHRSNYLKDYLADEFLADVAKLESKQYSAQIKRGIVENMFNKYAFLGRVAA